MEKENKNSISKKNYNNGFPVNTFLNKKLGTALLQYQNDFAFTHAQDVVKLALTYFLAKQGYLKK
jgi:hypothetical protein